MKLEDDMNKELAKTLTLALVNYLDENKPESAMCCSNTDCENIRAAFEEGEYDCVEAFIQKKLSSLTEFEDKLISFALQCGGQWDTANEEAKKWSSELLALAKKELVRRDEDITLNNLGPYDKGFQNGKAEAMAYLERTFESNPEKLPQWLKNKLAKKHLEGYTLGKEDAMRDMRDYLKSHFHSEEEKGYNPPAINVPTWTPPCYYGGPCTNPFKDCINCPRTNMVISPNTAFGTSTATLHGNTSATDGKEHNPSFTD